MKLIIDTDAGVDDSQAILMALSKRAQGVDVLAITTVEGNATRDHCTNNVLRILNFAKRTDIPVYMGCNRSVMGAVSPGTGTHGNDGMGDVTHLYPPSQQPLQQTHAVNAMIDQVNKHPGEITLVTLGPLTNVAVALRLDEEFCKKLKALYIMGGNTQGRGNMSPCAEFNFYCDPEAVHIVLNGSGIQPVIVPLEACKSAAIGWNKYNALMSSVATPRAQFIRDTSAVYNNNKQKWQPEINIFYDQLAMATALNSDVITESKQLYVTMETQGSLTRGQMVIDWRGKLGKEANATVVMQADGEKLVEMFHETILQVD